MLYDSLNFKNVLIYKTGSSQCFEKPSGLSLKDVRILLEKNEQIHYYFGVFSKRREMMLFDVSKCDKI